MRSQSLAPLDSLALLAALTAVLVAVSCFVCVLTIPPIECPVRFRSSARIPFGRIRFHQRDVHGDASCAVDCTASASVPMGASASLTAGTRCTPRGRRSIAGCSGGDQPWILTPCAKKSQKNLHESCNPRNDPAVVACELFSPRSLLVSAPARRSQAPPQIKSPCGEIRLIACP